MSYAELKITEADYDLITQEVNNLTKAFGVKAGTEIKNGILSINPASPQEIVAQFIGNKEEDILQNFEDAKEAHQFWGRELRWNDRVTVMNKFYKEVQCNRYHLTAAIVLECGKDQMEAFAEVKEFIELMEYYLQIYSQNKGYTLPMELEKKEHTSSWVVYKPFGTFATITPFNFPVAMAGMCFAALLTGNTVVWKPAPETLLTGLLLYNCFPKHLIKQSVFNFTVCEENIFGNVLLGNPDLVDGLAFIGSTEVGLHLSEKLNCQRRRRGARRIITEMGGNNSCIVTPSANLADAGWGMAKSSFGCCAQKCSALGRAIIYESIVDKVVDAIAGSAKKMFVMGDPRDRNVTLGPVIHKRAFNAYHECLKIAYSASQDAIFPLQKPAALKEGYFVEPVIIRNLPPNHSFFKKELFVPILRIQDYSGDIKEAVHIANDIDYGLTAGIYTNDDQEKRFFFDNIEAGVTYANRRGGATTGAWPKNQAFGGWKNSGWCTQHGMCGPNYLLNFVRGQNQYDATLRQ